jgi:hypothetical protein
MPLVSSGTSGGTDGAAIWRIWTSSSSTVTTNTVTVDPWSIWMSSTGSTYSTAASNSSLWYTWVRQTYPLVDGLDRPPRPAYVAPPETPEQRAAREQLARDTATRRRAESAIDELAAEAAKTRAAHARSKKLLLECLSPAQRDQLEKFDYFDVELPNGHAYRIHRGRSHNVRPLVNGREADLTLCAHPGPWVPDYDNALAQKLMLEHDEPGFLRLANRGGGRVAEQAVPWLAGAPRPN